MLQSDITTLQRLAQDQGLNLIGVTSPTVLTEEISRLSSWQEKGFFGDMRYLNRPVGLLTDPRQLLPSVASILTFAVPYQSQHNSEFRVGYGRVARYAWGKDYHFVLKQALTSFVAAVIRHYQREIDYSVFTDAVPLLERALARQSGLGWIGKNTMLINSSYGSFTFLADLLWNLRVADCDQMVVKLPSHCGKCKNCQDVCPTGAFLEPYLLDARRCISYLTIEKRGALTRVERELLGSWVFGCDLCQEACPSNCKVIAENPSGILTAFRSDQGVGEFLDLGMVLSIRSDAEFQAQFAGTALLRSRRAGLLRNAACVAANTAAEQTAPLLEQSLKEDRSAVVRQHSLWALVKLQKMCNIFRMDHLKKIVEQAEADPDEQVRQEASDLLEIDFSS